jgi:hypothetical protein
MARIDLDVELAALEAMPLAQLRERWSDLTGRPIPRVRTALLQMALAWELQAAVHGGLSRQVQQQLEQLAAGKTETRRHEPGMRLMREWNGVLHVVNIADDGAICWNEKTWNSLSSVARAITGTRWSGPAFFGLKQKKQAA